MYSDHAISWFTSEDRRAGLTKRATLLDLFTITDRNSSDIAEEFLKIVPSLGETSFGYHGFAEITDDMYTHCRGSYIVIDIKNEQYAIEPILYSEEEKKAEVRFIRLGRKADEVPLDIYAEFKLKSGMIENYVGEEETTIGRYLLNYVVLASIFGNKVPYINGIFDAKKVEAVIGQKALGGEITAEQIGTYLNQAFFLGSMTELYVPVFSKKALTPPPDIGKVKAELLKKYADNLDNPVICAEIEDELIKHDKNYLKGDPAMGFYGSASKKFNVHRKRQYLAVGLMEEFKQNQGDYSFIEGALIDGWEKSAIPTFCNDIRKGSYNRGIETAEGGVQTKKLMRLLQNLRITEEDCNTSRGLMVAITQQNVSAFYGRNVFVGPTKLETITPANQTKFIGNTWKMRSFMYCQTTGGFCYTCGGESFRTLDMDSIGSLALELGSAFLLMSMKAMHGTKMSSFVVENLDEYLV
jgi:hypothetical protein